MLEAVKELGIPLIDTQATYREIPDPMSVRFSGESHLNPAGYKIMAEQMSRAVERAAGSGAGAVAVAVAVAVAPVDRGRKSGGHPEQCSRQAEKPVYSGGGRFEAAIPTRRKLMAGESCGICGGDGRIANSFSGSTATCPGCHGTGRRSEDTGLRDVTKTKPSHFRQPNKPGVVEKQQGPTSFDGLQLAKEVGASAHLSSGTKTKLTLEIVEHEATHGKCTQTFIKKIRKQLRAPGS